MTEPLHIVLDGRAGRTVLATVQRDRVIDTRRLEHPLLGHAAVLAQSVAVLRERAPGPVAGVAGVWRHAARLQQADAAAFAQAVAEIGRLTALPTTVLPLGAALAVGEWRRAPAAGPLAVLALDVGVAGGVVLAGASFDPWRLDLGHWTVQADGAKCTCGARGCLELFASELAQQELARDLDLSLEEPSATDWQTLMDAHLAQLQRDGVRSTQVLTLRAGWAIGLAAARLADTFGVVELRVRTRHPDLWQVLAAPARAAALQVAGPYAPVLAAADPGEDAFFVGAVPP